MVYLVLSIIANVLIFLAFRSFPMFKIDNIQAIVFNYIVCVLTGILFNGNPSILVSIDLSADWSWFALIIGSLLIIGFYAASLTAQMLGVTITAVASKMSMVFPILFSLFFMKINSKDFTFLNYSGMVLALISIYLGSIRKSTKPKVQIPNKLLWLLPFAVFVAGGFIDISINYSNYTFINPENEEIFPILLFACAALIGIIILALKKKKIILKNVLGGIYLGIPNYFALYFVFKALTVFQNNGAVFYPIYNLGIILLSSVSAMILYKEKLSKINFVGLGFSILALFLLSYQEIYEYFSM